MGTSHSRFLEGMSGSESGSTSGDEREQSKIVDVTYQAPDVIEALEADTEVVEAVGNGWEDMALLEGLGELTSVCLRNNRIKKVENLGAASKLEELDMYGNSVKVVEGIEHLAALRVLDLSFNLVRDMSPLGSGFASLTKLYLCANKISAICGLDSVPALEVLELGSNRIRKIENLEAVPRLRELWLGRNKITKLEGLSALTELEILDVQSNRITVLEGLEENSKLTDLYLSHNMIEELTGLDALACLETLDVSNNALAHFPNDGSLPLATLTEFWANHNTISDWKDVDVLKAAPGLATVYFEGNPIAEHPRYRAIVKETLPQVQQIDALFIRG